MHVAVIMNPDTGNKVWLQSSADYKTPVSPTILLVREISGSSQRFQRSDR